MLETSLNLRNVTLNLQRREVVDLMMACTSVMMMECTGSKYRDLHDKLRKIVDDFDREVMNDGN